MLHNIDFQEKIVIDKMVVLLGFNLRLLVINEFIFLLNSPCTNDFFRI